MIRTPASLTRCAAAESDRPPVTSSRCATASDQLSPLAADCSRDWTGRSARYGDSPPIRPASASTTDFAARATRVARGPSAEDYHVYIGSAHATPTPSAACGFTQAVDEISPTQTSIISAVA